MNSLIKTVFFIVLNLQLFCHLINSHNYVVSDCWYEQSRCANISRSAYWDYEINGEWFVISRSLPNAPSPDEKNGQADRPSQCQIATIRHRIGRFGSKFTTRGAECLL